MALKVVEAYYYVRVRYGAAYLSGLDFFAVYGYIGFVGALYAVGYYHLAAGGVGGVAVYICGLYVLRGVLAGAHVEGVAVGKEGYTATLLYVGGKRPCVLRPEVGQVAKLAEVYLDGDKLMVEVYCAQAGPVYKAGQLLGQVFREGCAHIRKVDL